MTLTKFFQGGGQKLPICYTTKFDLLSFHNLIVYFQHNISHSILGKVM